MSAVEFDITEDLTPVLDEDALTRIVALANLLAEQDDTVAALTEELTAAKEAAQDTRRNALPQLLNEYGISELALVDGSRVVCKRGVEARITEEAKPAALRWLTEHSYGGLIKTNITIQFPREEHDLAVETAHRLGEEFEGVEYAESVHSATLKSFVKERLEAGDDIPRDLFGVSTYDYATIETPKKKRGK